MLLMFDTDKEAHALPGGSGAVLPVLVNVESG